ncbi:hypothetical protein HPB49_014037 [Dermacentor silvarum]|uniref:Uncharacterized protein n=1 Tax=Dermacentor silvarum TaxID=543639 RepID=A0ACB8CY17_DERSI|nr:hypothetical protein HPB49_014037 [Dermacentor silvarum]
MRLVKEINDLIEANEFNLASLRTILQRLEKSTNELTKINGELHAEMSDDEVVADYDSVLEYEDQAAGALGLLTSTWMDHGALEEDGAARRAQQTRLVKEINDLIEANEFNLASLRTILQRLEKSTYELTKINGELHAEMSDDEVVADYDSAYRDEDGRLSDAPRSGRHSCTSEECDLLIVAAAVADPFQSAGQIKAALNLQARMTLCPCRFNVK